MKYYSHIWFLVEILMFSLVSRKFLAMRNIVLYSVCGKTIWPKSFCFYIFKLECAASLRATKRGFCHFSATTLSWWLGPILFIVQHSLVGCDIWVQSSVSGCFHSQSVIRWHGPSKPEGLGGPIAPRDPLDFSRYTTKTYPIICPSCIACPPRFSNLPTAL